MYAEEARLASFSVAVSGSSSSTSKKKQAKTDANAWPHPTTGRGAKTSGIPLPSTLAKFGFYHTPSDDAPDCVTHFLYPEAVISGWESGDDPLVRLDQAVPDNGWCKIFWSLDKATENTDDVAGASTWTWSQADLLPTSKNLIEARKQTFGALWPYDGKKGWKPTSKKLAEAGFYFTPTDEEEDSATCIYCKKGLGGWEKGDDPIHEHKKRKPDCPFFNCVLVAEPRPAEEAETKDNNTEEDVDAGIQMPKRGKRVVSTARKPSSRANKSKDTVEPSPAASEVVVEPVVDQPPARTMRAASRRATKAIELLSSDTDVNRIPRKEEVLKQVQHATTDPVPFPSSDPIDAPASDPIGPGATANKPKRNRSKNKKLDDKPVREPTPQPAEAETTVIEHQDDENEGSDVEQVEEVEEVEQPKRRGRARPTKTSTLETTSAIPPPTRTRKVSKKILATSEPAPDEEEPVDAVVETPDPPIEVSLPPSKSGRSVSSAKSKKSNSSKKSTTSSKSASRRASTTASAQVEDSENADVPPNGSSDDVMGDTEADLATAVSQATIRASDEDRAGRVSVTGPGQLRQPLSQLSQPETLQLDDKQRNMTLGLWLQFKADAAAQEMRQNGLAQLQDLENQMQTGRIAVERALRGEHI